MKQVLYSLLIALTCTTNIMPLTINSTLLENKDTGKRVLLLGDGHDCHTETILKSYPATLESMHKAAQSALVIFDKIKNQQKEALTSFAHALLADNNEKSDQTIVISEISIEKTKSFCADNLTSLQTMNVLPHVFVQDIAQSASTEKEKRTLIEQSMSSFGIKAPSAFQARNGIRLIAGDCFREGVFNNPDFLLRSCIEEADLVSFKEKLRALPIAGIENITIGNLKKSLLTWYTVFAKVDQKEIDTKQLLTFIDDAIKNGQISETITLIDAAIALRQNTVLQKTVYDHLLKLWNNKCNLELFCHVILFEKDASLNYLILNAGGAHVRFVKKWLIQNGYHIIEQSGNHALGKKLKIASSEELITLFSQAFNELEKQSPLVLLPKLFQA